MPIQGGKSAWARILATKHANRMRVMMYGVRPDVPLILNPFVLCRLWDAIWGTTVEALSRMAATTRTDGPCAVAMLDAGRG
jgi:hypothetical protein